MQTGVLPKTPLNQRALRSLKAPALGDSVLQSSSLNPMSIKRCFQEVTTHMTRGLITHISDLERQQNGGAVGEASSRQAQ